MTGHIALPALHDGATLPATLSPYLLRSLLREEMGFQGIIISDAMDMGAIEQGQGQVIDAIAATAAGVDLLLLNQDINIQKSVYSGLYQAAQRQLLALSDLNTSAKRILALKKWVE